MQFSTNQWEYLHMTYLAEEMGSYHSINVAEMLQTAEENIVIDKYWQYPRAIEQRVHFIAPIDYVIFQ